jgi:hypothetical protein
MTEAFLDLRASRHHSALAFWSFILADVCRSAGYQQLHACRSGVRRCALQWIASCTLGIIATGLIANSITWGFSYFYHPYLEGVDVAPWMFGAFLGFGLGIAQYATLRHRRGVGHGWLLVTVVSAAIGVQILVTLTPEIGLFGAGVVLGGLVGTVQWLVLRRQIRRAAWSTLASGVALAAAVVMFGAMMHRTFAGMNPLSSDVSVNIAFGNALKTIFDGMSTPRSWTELAVEITFMTMSGLVVGALTARPVSSIPER